MTRMGVHNFADLVRGMQLLELATQSPDFIHRMQTFGDSAASRGNAQSA